jgi:predicted RNase H-like HicB family nuclease
MRFLVRIYRHEGDYSAMVPDLPGCVAVAKSINKVRKMIAEAIAMHLELMRESGEPIPTPTQHLDFTIDEEAEEEFCTWVKVQNPQAAAL